MGGAETLCAELAQLLVNSGDRVEILTTCARDNRSWTNELEPGSFSDMGLAGRRFEVDERNLESWIPNQIAIAEGMRLPLEKQLDWMAESVNSSDLYRYIADKGDRFDLMFFAPYLFGTTFWGSMIHPQRSVLIPCLHDESYAYTEVVGHMMRSVRGCIFNADEEQDLCQRLFGRVPGEVVGMPFGELEELSLKPYFESDFPYLLYLGRKETGKGVHILLDHFVAGKERGLLPDHLKLVIVGGGDFSDLHRPQYLERDDVVDLAYLKETDKRRVIQFSTAFVQPSANESFSIVLMESWLMSKPALVSADSQVMRGHVVRSGGGLYYRTVEDFCSAAIKLVEDRELAEALGSAGKRYVLSTYSHEQVRRRLYDAIDMFASSDSAVTV
jgi:glycosyltransferase involved in cell wall biosynthesis